MVALSEGERRDRAMEAATLAQKKYIRRVETMARAARAPKTNEAMVAGLMSSLSRIENLLADLVDAVRWQKNNPSRTQ